MYIKLNGEDKSIECEIKLYDFVSNELNGKEPNGIAVALNEMVIPKQKWESVTITENDSIEIIHAVQGG
jgi:sulfur carrier protein